MRERRSGDEVKKKEKKEKGRQKKAIKRKDKRECWMGPTWTWQYNERRGKQRKKYREHWVKDNYPKKYF